MIVVTKKAIREALRVAREQSPNLWVPVVDGLEVRAMRKYPTPGSNPRFEWVWIYDAKTPSSQHGFGSGAESAIDFIAGIAARHP